MRNNKKILFFCLSLLLIPIFSFFAQSAVVLDTGNLMHCWSYDNADIIGSTAYDSTGNYNGTFYGSVAPTTGVPGILGEAVYFQTDQNMNTTIDLTVPYKSSLTASIWMKTTKLNNNARPIDIEGRTAYMQISGSTIFAETYDGGIKTTPAISANTDVWEHWVITRNATELRLYKNGTVMQKKATGVAVTASRPLRIGAVYDATSGFINATIDNIQIFNKSFTEAEVILLNNNMMALNCTLDDASTPPVSPTLNISDSVPADDYNTNNPLLYLWTSVNSSLDFNCSLVLNGTINDTIYHTSGTEVNASFLLNFTMSESSSYNWSIRCYNPSDNLNTTYKVFNYDSVSPLATINRGNAFNVLNLSDINQYKGILPINITFSDNRDLYAFQINITKDGITYYNRTNSSISGTTKTQKTILNVSSWESGLYDIEILVSDSHTSNLIDDYEVTKEKDKLKFKTSEGNIIEIISYDKSTTDTEKIKDRYTFSFVFDDKLKKKRTFVVKSDHKITYRQNSGYKAHFVIFDGFKGNWIDFEGVNGIPEIIKISDYEYTISFDSLGSEVKFKSIGGLNVNSYYYHYFIGNYSADFYNKPIGSGENFTAYLNMTFSNSTQLDLNALLYFNGVIYNTIKSSKTGYISFYKQLTAPTVGNYEAIWIINQTQINGSIVYFNISENQSVYDWEVSNCTSGNVSLVFTLWHEDYPSIKKNNTNEIEVFYWLTSVYNMKNYTYKYDGGNDYKLCLYPHDANITLNLYSKYSVVGGFTHRYYLVNYTISNNTVNISLYNFNTTVGKSDLKITARVKATYAYYENVIARLQRKYIADGVWRTVQMDESGDYGNIFFNVIEETTDYRILYFDRNNQLLKQTESLKFVCTDGVCEFIQLLEPYEATTVTTELYIQSHLNNITRILNVNWSDSLGNENLVNVIISKETLSGQNKICDVFQTGAAGTTNCNLTGFTGDVKLTVLTSHSPYTPALTKYYKLGSSGLSIILSRSDSVLIIFIIGLLTMAMGSLGLVAMIISFIGGLIMIYFMGFLTPISSTFILGAAGIGAYIALKVGHHGK